MKILAVFCGIGPLIGLVVFATGLSLIVIGGGQADGFWIGPFILLYGILFAHVVGLPWAGLAGVAAVVLSRFAGPHPWIGAASGVVSFAIAVLSGNVTLPPGVGSSAAADVDSFGEAFFGLMAVVHVLSAIACWLIARRLIRD